MKKKQPYNHNCIEDIWKLSHDQNIYNCCYIYRKTNRIIDCLTKKCIFYTDSNI